MEYGANILNDTWTIVGNATVTNGEINIPDKVSGVTQEIELDGKGSIGYKLEYEVESGEAYESKIRIHIDYKEAEGEEEKANTEIIELVKYKGISELEIELGSANIDKIRVSIEGIVKIKGVGLYKSKEVDIDIDQLIEVTKEYVLSAEVMESTACFVEGMYVEVIQTNLRDCLSISEYQERVCNIVIQDNKLKYVEDVQDSEEVEDLKIGGEVQLYYTAVGEEEQAYKYFTITDPVKFVAGADGWDTWKQDELREKFKVKRHKVVSEIIKEENIFVDEILENGTNANIPLHIIGAGNGVVVVEALQRFSGIELKEMQVVEYKGADKYEVTLMCKGYEVGYGINKYGAYLIGGEINKIEREYNTEGYISGLAVTHNTGKIDNVVIERDSSNNITKIKINNIQEIEVV